MNESWSDLSPLDPGRDPERWEALLRRTRAAARGELARRALAGPLARWVRPALPMAAALAMAAGGVLALTEAIPQSASAQAPGVAEAMGVPYAMTVSAEAGASDAADQLLLPDAPESR